MKIVFTIVSLFLLCADMNPRIGTEIDNLHGVPVYYNGSVANVHGRHISSTGYNLGLKWQCVEFVKRYYYSMYGHEFPSSYGNAKDFFDKNLYDNSYNAKRGLQQYRNVRYIPPQVGDIVVYDGTSKNPYGHVAIVAEITQDSVELIQQNVRMESRVTLPLKEYEGIYTIADYEILGWLRMR